MNHEKLNTLLFINTQQSVFNYFYNHNKAYLDGEFVEPKSRASLNISTASSCMDEDPEPAIVSADKTPFRRSTTQVVEEKPTVRSRSLKFTHFN